MSCRPSALAWAIDPTHVHVTLSDDGGGDTVSGKWERFANGDLRVAAVDASGLAAADEDLVELIQANQKIREENYGANVDLVDLILAAQTIREERYGYDDGQLGSFSSAILGSVSIPRSAFRGIRKPEGSYGFETFYIDEWLTAAEKLAKLKRLIWLRLSSNELTVPPRGLENLTQLLALDLSNNELTEVRGLEKLTQLTQLDLSNNKLTNVRGLETLARLTGLSLSRNQTVGNMKALFAQKALYSASPILPQAAFPARGGAAGRPFRHLY